jgi:hypothetical protein
MNASVRNSRSVKKKKTGGSIHSAFSITTPYQSQPEIELRAPEYRIKSGIQPCQHHKQTGRNNESEV